MLANTLTAASVHVSAPFVAVTVTLMASPEAATADADAILVANFASYLHVSALFVVIATPDTTTEPLTALSFAAVMESFASLTAPAFLALEASAVLAENTLVSASAPARAN